MDRKWVKPIYFQISDKDQKTIFLDTTIFQATDLTSYAKMISLWGFFVFVRTFCIGFTRAKKYYVKVIVDDIYNRIIEFKAKDEIIKMNRNYSNVDKRIWTHKYVHDHNACDKNNSGYVNAPFLSTIDCYRKLRKCVDEQLCANVQSLVTKQSILTQNETQLKRKRPKFFIALDDILYQV